MQNVYRITFCISGSFLPSRLFLRKYRHRRVVHVYVCVRARARPVIEQTCLRCTPLTLALPPHYPSIHPVSTLIRDQSEQNLSWIHILELRANQNQSCQRQPRKQISVRTTMRSNVSGGITLKIASQSCGTPYRQYKARR